MMQNDLLLRVANREVVERPPVWLMRQAGRILPQYRKLRNSFSGFKEFVKNPEAVCEVTIQPVDALEVDAAIIFSDILVIPEAMGLDYEMVEQKGPIFPETVATDADLKKLRVAEAEDLNYVMEGIRLTKRELNGRVPLIGFAGAPWTIFSYMTEGSGSKTFSQAKRLLYQNPEWSHKLLRMITDSTIAYLKAQIKAGVDLVQVFDSWAAILSPDQYREFGLAYIEQICDEIYEVPITVFAKGANASIGEISQLNCQIIGLDWTVEVEDAKEEAGRDAVFQGNLDPCVLYANRATIEKETRKMLMEFGTLQHVANLGHGVYPDTPVDGVKAFINSVKNFQLNFN